MSDLQFEVEAFFDGDCPLCRREVSMLRRLDRKNKIRFTDIADDQFHTQDYQKTHDELMAEMHARLPDGRWVTGVEVFRRLYAAVGFKWIVWPTRLPVISHCLDLGYRIFARNRLKWTGRCSSRGGSCTVTSDTK